jgi:hypothetical protein
MTVIVGTNSPSPASCEKNEKNSASRKYLGVLGITDCSAHRQGVDQNVTNLADDSNGSEENKSPE